MSCRGRPVREHIVRRNVQVPQGPCGFFDGAQRVVDVDRLLPVGVDSVGPIVHCVTEALRGHIELPHPAVERPDGVSTMRTREGVDLD